MSPGLRLELLGTLRLTIDGTEHTRFVSSKVPALLAYLAVSGRQHSRAALAGLLWDNLPETDARRNLRVVLADLRPLADRYLVVTRQTIAFNRDSNYVLDTEVFERELRVARPLASLEAAEQLSRAVGRYRADFLDGFFIRGATGFDEWMTLERERLRRLVLEALHDLVAYFAARSAVPRAIEHATRLLALDPLHEEIHRQLMLLYVYSGQRSAALAQYERCREALADGIGMRPSAETSQLYEQICAAPTAAWRTETALASVARAANTHPLPPQRTSFVGREAELSRIARRLEDPDCRLLTIVGPGGIGKTRLALQAAATCAASFADGVVFVPLATVTAPEYIMPVLAAALKVAPAGQDDLSTLVRDVLRERELLLLLDNFEHLRGGAALLLDLLDAAPGVRLIVTSRERLALQAEHLLQLDGLAYPPVGHDEQIAHYDAVQLFVERARRVNDSLTLSAETSAAVAQICRALEGMPLAIELAADWMRAMSCQEIAEQIERSPITLAADLRDLPERHRSLQAVFDHSLALLSTDERIAFQRIAVFFGAFTLEAAQAVTGVAPVTLATLCDRSMLRREPDGRLSLHPLLRHYANAVQPGDRQAIHDAHASYYAAFVAQHEHELKGAGQRVALEAMLAEMDNICEAWNWSVGHGRIDLLDQAAEGFCLFYRLQSWLAEGEAALRLTLQYLPVPPNEAGATLARLIAWHGWFCLALGHESRASAAITEALALAERSGAPGVAAFCRATQGIAASQRGAREEAIAHLQASLALAHAAADRTLLIEPLNELGALAWEQGDINAARGWWTESLAICGELGDRAGAARVLSSLGDAARALGEIGEARRAYERSLALLRETGQDSLQAAVLGRLGLEAQAEGRLSEATQRTRESLLIARRIGHRRGIAATLARLGDVLAASGAHGEAQAHYSESIAIFHSLDDLRGVAAGLVGLGRLAARRGDHHGARRSFEQGLAAAQHAGDRVAAGIARGGLGHAAAALGDMEAARQAFAAALDLFHEVATTPDALELIVGAADLLLHTHEQPEAALRHGERALELLTVALHHPATWRDTRAWATRLRAELSAQLPSDLAQAAEARGLQLARVCVETRRIPALNPWSYAAA